MKLDNTKTAGTILFIGAVQWFLGMLLAEALYPGYSSRIDYVSDLGTGPTAIIYNASVFLLGVCILVSTYFLEREYEFRPFSFMLLMTGIGAMGVGVFPANMQPWHSIATLLALVFGALSAILSFKIQAKPLSYVSVLLGALALVTAIIFFPYLGLPVGATDTYLGMAKGSLERWVINPILAWAIGFGAALVGKEESKE
ncbi:MAG: DUF998 domain-containing protein [Candidatus Thorarchaeota archaeon]|jgi:hypothetical membrane protein